jgi:HEAT repeat protein
MSFISKIFGPPDVDKLLKKNDVKGLIKAVDYKDSEVRKNAVLAMKNVEDRRVVDALIIVMKNDKDSFVRCKAAYVLEVKKLESVEDERVVSALIEVLKNDKDDNVRGSVAIALGHKKDVRVGDALLYALMDKSIKNSAWVVFSLGEIRERRAVKLLIQIMQNGENEWIRGSAVESLGKIGDPSAAEPLIHMLEHGDRVRLRAKAAISLAAVKDARVEGKLVQALMDSCYEVREGAARALTIMKWKPIGIEKIYYLMSRNQWSEVVNEGKAAVEPLIEIMMDKDSWNREREEAKQRGEYAGKKAPTSLEENRASAAESLGKIKDAKAVEPLTKVLSSYDSWWVRVHAANALGAIGDIRAREPLSKILQYDDPSVYDAAQDALKSLEE